MCCLDYKYVPLCLGPFLAPSPFSGKRKCIIYLLPVAAVSLGFMLVLVKHIFFPLHPPGGTSAVS